MRSARGLLPASMLERIRLGATAAACVSMLVQLGHIVASGGAWGWDVTSICSTGLLGILLVVTYRTGRPVRLDVAAVPVLLVLARSGLDDPLTTVGLILMLSATDVAGVHRLGAQAADELVALTPGVAVLFVRRHDDGVEVFSAAGVPRSMIATVLPESVLTDPASRLRAALPAMRHWFVEEMAPGRYRILAGVRELGEDVLAAFRTMAHQVLLAESSRLSHDELEHRAHHDPLTRLPNRALFFRRLADAVDLRPPGATALLNIDLDDFKQVNDTYGHAAGDDLLVEIAQRLAVAGGAHGCPARFGGDEFALLLTDVPEAAAAVEIAERLCRSIIAPVHLSGVTVSVGASVGVAMSRAGLTAADLSRCADIAMYSAKARGKNRVELFDTGRHGDIARHRTLEQHLGHAVARGEIQLRYQPFLELPELRCIGVEASATWAHPAFGAIGPADLFALARRTGDLDAIGRHLFRTACAEFGAVAAGPALGLSIPLHPHQLGGDSLTGLVLATLAEHGLQPGQLLLQIAATEQLSDPRALAELRRLADAGVRIGLDDFGTESVSLAALEAFPVDQVTIDAGGAGGNRKRLDMVAAVGHLLGARTVAQRVDTAALLDSVRHSAAGAAQGDLLAPPMTAPQLKTWLAAAVVT